MFKLAFLCIAVSAWGQTAVTTDAAGNLNVITTHPNEHGKVAETVQVCRNRYEDGWWDFVKCDKPEPIDVPAVQETRKKWISNCWNSDGTEGCNWPETVETCKDKYRILLHDENTPPKYWCHKVQTQ